MTLLGLLSFVSSVSDSSCSYGSCIDVNMFTLVTEIFPSHLRAQGTSLASAVFFLTDILWLQLEPTATARIGWKYYLVFVCLCVVHTVYLYFQLPEVSLSPFVRPSWGESSHVNIFLHRLQELHWKR